MPTPPTIDIESLLQPIPGDDPAGSLLSGPIDSKFKDLREEFDPTELDPADPQRNEPRRDANWQGVIDLGEETLKELSKSLLVGARMVEALTMKSGFAGARDGLRLLRKLCEDCWERSYPKVEEPEDLDARAVTFEWLDDDKNGSLYPNKLKGLPLLVSGATRITVIAWKGVPNDKMSPPTINADQIAAAARASSSAVVQNMMDDVTETIDEVNQLGNVLTEKMGKDLAPSFYKIREALEDCRTLALGITKVRAESGDSGEVAGEAAASGTAGVAGAVTSREGAYKQLEAAADALARAEPHSPVPYLVKRAVQLKNIQFPDLVEQLTKDANVLAFLKRDLEAPE